MSRVARVEDTATIRLSSYDSVDKSYYSISNAGNAYGNTTSSYCAVNLTRGANAYTYVYFKFNTSSIPSDAEIVSVACTTRVAISNQTAANVASKGAKVCSGTTEKTAAVSVTTSVANRTFTMGTWTREELNDVRIKYYATRGTSNTNSNYNLRVYVGTLTVKYAVNEYYYDVLCKSSSPSISFSGDGEFSSGDSTIVTITGDITDAVVTDNGVDITNSLSGSGTTHTYTINGIVSDHAISVTFPSPEQQIFYKQNGSWVLVDKIFIKQNGTWTGADKLYIKENGAWKGGSQVSNRLPSGYTEVLYIENETTARINTGISGISEWTLTAELITDPKTSGVLLARGTAGGHYFSSIPSASNNWGVGSSSGEYVAISAFTKESISINFSSSTVISGTIDGNTFSRTAESSSSSSIYLFNATSSSAYPFKGRIYGDVVCIKDNAEVFRGVPCTDPNGVAGLYDLIGQSFKGSTNSETFKAGPVR